MTIADERRRWSRVKAIFDATLQQPSDARTAFVEEACRDDSGLRADVQSLLAAHETAGSFAERPAMAVLASAAHAAHGPALEAGREIGPYRIVGPLGTGGMSEVYRALDTELRREVAVKVLPATRSGDPAWSARLQQEARVLASLTHPGIGTIYGLQRAGDVLAMVMELVEGPTLADRLRRGPLPPDEALAVARQIADALEAAHEKGVIHCDLKPANVKLTAAGDVKVLDFGLAHLVRAPAGDSARDDVGAHGSPGGITGTPACMSPEQVRGGRVDARTDVWAFGCLLYEMLTGHPAFGRSTVAETLGAVMEDEPDWGRLPASVPVDVRRLLRRCLARDPRRRLHHIADARLELDDAIVATGDDATDRADAGTRARRLAIAVAALAIACAATLGVLLVRAPVAAPGLRAVEITTPRTPDPWSFAVSPDGRLVAFVAERDSQPMLWVRALDTATAARVLPGTEGARRPFWSPDSRSIGFFVTSEIRRIDVGGGAARRITLALAATAAAWGPDGTILYSGTTAPELYRVGAGGGTPRVVTAPAIASTGHRHPRFLPDGRRFLFFVGGPDALRGIHLGSLDGPEVTRLVASDGQGAYVAPGWLLFVRQDTLWAQRVDVERRRVTGDPIAVADGVAFEPIDGTAAFSVSDTGVLAYRTGRPTLTQFAWFDRAGRSLGAFGSPEQTGLTNLRLSPDGGRLAADRSLQNETDVWVLDAAHQIRVTHASDTTATRLPVWFPDGARLAFQSIRSGSVALAAKAATGEGPEEVLFASPEPKIPCDWSPDGRFLVYYVPTQQTGTDLWMLPMDTRVPSVFLRTDANELWGQFSPDGRWMAYQSNETGRYEIYVRPFPSGGAPIPVSTAGGVYPRWSRDGREIYFVAPDATLTAVKLRETPGTLEAGAPEPLFRTRRLGGGLNVIGRGPQYDVTTDGRFLVNVDTQSTATPITLLLNWTPESAAAARAGR